jgi:hypothetical protein
LSFWTASVCRYCPGVFGMGSALGAEFPLATASTLELNFTL